MSLSDLTKRVVLHDVGTVVMCENGHEVCDIVKPLYRGDFNYSHKFQYWRPKQKIPTKGEPFPLRCWCGSIYLDGNMSAGCFKFTR